MHLKSENLIISEKKYKKEKKECKKIYKIEEDWE